MNAILHWFDDPRWIRLGLSLIHFLWQGALLGVAAGMLMTWMRGASSRRRYAALLIVLSAMAAAPIATLFLLPTSPSHAKVSDTDLAAPALLASRVPVASPAASGSQRAIAPAIVSSDQFADGGPVGVAAEANLTSRLSSAWRWVFGRLSWFVAAWMAGVCLFSARLAIGLGGASRLRRVGIAPAPEACRAQFAELAERLGLRRLADVCESTLVRVPVVVGWLQPVVLLPASVIAGLPEPELRAILAHELAHICRHDYLINMLQTVVETLLFYHPAVWWVSNAIRQEREQCCDDLAAEACGDKVVVAKALVRLAEVRALAAPAALAATGGRLARRIRRLLVGTRDSKHPAQWRSLAGSGLAALLTVAVVIVVNTFTGEFTQSKAVAEEPTRQGGNIQNSTRGESDPDASNANEGRAAKGLPVLSELPFVSRLFTVPAKVDVAGGGDEKPQSAGTEGKPHSAGQSRADRTETRRFSVEQLAAPISLDYREVPLDKALESLRDTTNLSIIVDESALKRLNMTEQRRISIKFSDMAVKDALRLILQAADPRLTYEVKEDYLFVTAADEKRSDDSAVPRSPPADADSLRQQLRRLEQQNDETRRELIRLEEQLKTEREKAHAQSAAAYVKRATDADVRQARQAQLQKEEEVEAAKLAGTWLVVATHVDGHDQPQTGGRTWEFRGHDVAIDSRLGSENDRGQNERRSYMYFVNPIKSQKEMTIYGKNMLIQAIYRLDGDALTICFFGRSEVDRPSSFKPTKDDVLPHTVWTLRRVAHEQRQSF